MSDTKREDGVLFSSKITTEIAGTVLLAILSFIYLYIYFAL